MRNGVVFKTLVKGLCASLVLIGAFSSSAYAQDEEMTFGDEDAKDAEENADFDFSDDDFDTPPGEGVTVTGTVMRADPSLDAGLTEALGASLMSGLDQLPGYQSTPNNGLNDKFASLGEQGSLDCAYNPICLSRLGQELGVERLVVGRLSGTEGEYNLNLDLINVADGTVENYVSRTVKGGQNELQGTIVSSLPRLFNIRKARKSSGKSDPVEAKASPLQKGFAWGTAGVAVVCVGAGVFFGLQASGAESDLEDGERDSNNVYAVTQKEAQDMLDDAESDATLANIFYGVGLAAAVTSALLFTVTFGEDIATEEELSQAPLDNFRVSPVIAPDGESVGLSAGFDW